MIKNYLIKSNANHILKGPNGLVSFKSLIDIYYYLVTYGIMTDY